MSSLLRSTKFVRYFAGAARTLILNSAKSVEANTLLSSKILPATSNVHVKDYATSKKSESLEPLLQKLDNEVRRLGRISKRNIDEVFDEIRGRQDITSSQSLLVIRCCGELVPEELPEQRTLLVQKIWSVLTERGVPMDISHYNALLRVYIENEHPFSPAEFLAELEKKGLQPNRVTYQRLMWRYCQEGDVDGATRVLEKMRELNMPVSEPVLNALVMGHSFHGDTDGAKAVLETMAAAGLQPTNRTYALLACGYAKKGDLDGVQSVIKTANEKEETLMDKDMLDIIESFVLAGHSDKALVIINQLEKGRSYSQEACTYILKLINKKQLAIAKELMKTLPANNERTDNLYKGAFFVKQLIKANYSPQDTIQTLQELQNERLVENAIFIATECALQQGLVELSVLLFGEMKKNGMELRQHYYWPLLAIKGKEKDEEGLIHILKTMTSEGLYPSGEALRDYVFPYLKSVSDPQNIIAKLQLANLPAIMSARNLMIDYLEAGKIKDAVSVALQYRPYGQFNLVYSSLIHSLNITKDIDSFVTILHVVSSSLSNNEENYNENEPPSVDSMQIGKIVKSAVKSLTDPALCETLFTKLLSKGLSISTDAAKDIEQYLGNNMTESISEKLSQLTSNLDIVPLAARPNKQSTDITLLNSNQLEILYEQSKTKGNPGYTARLQRQLITTYIKEDSVEKMNAFVSKLESEGFEFTPPLMAQLFEFYAKNNEIDKAYEYKDKIAKTNPDFLLSKYKLVVMALSLIRANRFDEAADFLLKNKPEDYEATFVLRSKCWQLLNDLAERKDVEKVKQFTKILTENNYVEQSNVLLGPSIKVHILKDDLEGALKEFEHCCKQYRCTPWKGELMKTLILKEDATRLQWLADMSTEIHGEVNTLHDLMFAFVECGRLRQARRILETPGMYTKPNRLSDACERYVEEGKSEHLESLLEATKELSYIDRSKIFFHLLQSYCKANETDKALGLWTLLQEEGEIPTDNFLIYLAKHLQENNRQVPFTIPEQAQQTISKAKPQQQQQDKPKKVTAANSNQDENVTIKVENLIKEGDLIKATETTLVGLKTNTPPRKNVIKYLFKNLAEKGLVEPIAEIGKLLDTEGKRRTTYTDKLTLAIFKSGQGIKHIDKVYENVKKAETLEQLDNALSDFPLCNALCANINNQELLNKCELVAKEAAEKQRHMPANVLWMEYLIAGKDEHADRLWKDILISSPTIAYRRLLQESFTQNRPQLIKKLLTCVRENPNINTESVLGNIYGRLINWYISKDDIQEARKALDTALGEGVPSEIFKKTLQRLHTKENKTD